MKQEDEPEVTASALQILVLDQGSHVLEAAVPLLRARGHHVTVCGDVASARMLFEASTIQMMVSERHDDEGLGFLRSVLQRQGAYVVLVLPPETDRHQDLLDLGADYYLAPPFDPPRVAACLALAEARATRKRGGLRDGSRREHAGRRHHLVAELGKLALTSDALPRLMMRTVEAVVEALDADHCFLFEHVPGDRRLAARAHAGAAGPDTPSGSSSEGANGESEDALGKSDIESDDATTLAGYSLTVAGPVMVGDVRRDSRFTFGPGVGRMASGLCVRIEGRFVPYGVLVVHARARDRFGEDEAAFLETVANVLAGAIQRRRDEEALRESEAKARSILETTVDGVITIDARGRIESFNPAAERIFGYTASEVIGQNVSVLMPAPYREEHDGYVASYVDTGVGKIIGIGREVVGARKDGSRFPMELAVSEVVVTGRRLFTGIVRDITERRRLEKEVLEVSEQERRRIGQDLHDGLGQMLTGIELISRNLEHQMRQEGASFAKDVGELADLVKEADRFARGLARGLVPVELEVNGLATALRRLAENATVLFGLRFTFKETGQVLLDDATTSTHLYRIAQEAVNNAARHSRGGLVSIVLASNNRQIRLRVHDDGVGVMPERLERGEGMGVRIMAYRARIIGGTLTVAGHPDGGTVVTCTVPLTGVS